MKKNPSNIVLLGFMGCGKTVIGKRLAQMLGYDFVDTDDLVTGYASMSIPHIFEKYGECYFRELEAKAAEEAAQKDQAVIATGGGIIKNKKNIEMLKITGVLVYLKADSEKIYKNTLNDSTRPLLQDGDRMENIQRLLTEREPLYVEYGDFVIDVSPLNVEQGVREILKTLNTKI